MKITIITATYNSGNDLKQCIESVLSQTYQNIEYIIIDNCSTDQTLDIAKNYSEQVSRIISEPDKGIYDALNKGIKIASGDVIGILHADDFYPSETIIEDVIKKFVETGVDSVYGDLQYVSKKKSEKVIRNWVAGEFSMKKLTHGWMPPHPTFFVKRKHYIEQGLFNTEYKIAADYDLMLRFLYKAKISVAYISKVIVKMRVGGTSNKNLANIYKKSAEDLNILKTYGVGGIYSLMLKNIRKVSQFF